MPELPEVETVIRELKSKIIGKQIQNLSIVWHKTFVNSCEIGIENQIVRALHRKGKYILIYLNRSVLIVHLRMTGQLLFMPQNGTQIDTAYLRTSIQFTDGSMLLFNDKRKFGRIYHVSEPEIILNKVGVDAMSPELDSEKFCTMVKLSKIKIKPFLLSQKYISGLGNIYVDESLFRSRIHPASVSSAIKESAVDNLFSEIRKVLTFAIKNMGSTISDYRDANGNVGNNQKFFKVYQQQGKACVNCGQNIEKIKLGGRGTHFCPNCQRIFQ